MDFSLKAIDENKWVKRELKIALGTEKGLRIIASCALLAITLNQKQFSLIGRTVNLTQVQSWANWSRGLILSHLFFHDVVGASKKTATSPDILGPTLDAMATLWFLHDNGLFDLGKQTTLVSHVLSGTFIAFSIRGLLTKVKQWENCKQTDEAELSNEAKLSESRRELLHASANLLLWVPAALGFGGGQV